jgi:hypothetical protein
MAFLSESSNRVTITRKYLKTQLMSDPAVSEAKRYLDIHDVSTIARKTIQ